MGGLWGRCVWVEGGGGKDGRRWRAEGGRRWEEGGREGRGKEGVGGGDN